MKIRLTVRYALLGACSILSSLFAGAASAQTIDIAPMTWTQRSDWINVKTDAAVTPHAVGDGVTDDTAALQAALTYAASTPNRYAGKKTVYIPAGTYKITSTLTWSGVTGGTIIGCGKTTILKWYGSTGAAMFWSQGTSRCRFVGLAWDGNGIASCGFLHESIGLYESRMRHENESFRNFVVSGTYSAGQTVPAAGIMGGLNTETTPTAEVMIWNCLFYNCSNGAVVGYQVYNNYMWLFDGCEFENCGIGVAGNDGKYVISNSHFAGSTVADTSGGVAARLRHCTSIGSAGFMLEGGPSGATSMGVVQDCWIDGWTGNQGAIRFGLRGPDNVFDCVFTHPPTGATAPIYLMSSAVNLIASNNYYPGLANLTSGNASTNLVNVPAGNLPGSITSPKQTFLQSTWPADSANILDITKPPYNCPLGGGFDDTVAIQQAINDAKAANNGSIVYLPQNGYGYNISSPLIVSGSNYKIQGSGVYTKLIWTGAAASGTMISVTSPQNLSLEQLLLFGSNNTTNMVVETSTGASAMTYDGVYTAYSGTNYQDGPGVVLSNLPSGSVVYAAHLDAPLTVNDCGPAQIWFKSLYNGQVTVKGATRAKTGFLGAAVAEGMQLTTTGYNITVNDNQDLVIGDYYNEQNYNDLNLQRGSATWTGKVTIQGFKEQANATSTQINVNNYAGRLMYGPQGFINNGPTIITHTGLNAFDLILPGDVFLNGAPTITTGAGCSLIEAGNLSIATSGTVTYRPNFPNPLTTANLTSMAAAFDHLRQLGAMGLWLDYGIYQALANPTFETDSANANPLTTLGFNPVGWVASGTYSTPAGVRNVTTVSAGSPFGTGGKSANFVDTTGTTAGGRLEFNQNIAPLSANTAGVLSFDVRLNSMTALNDDVWVRIFTATATPLNIHLMGGSASGAFGPAPLALDTWYRIRAVIPAPSAPGAATITLYVTPWAGTGPGTTSTYTVAGLAAPTTTGFSRLLFNAVGAGEKSNINLDNLALQNGTLACPYLP